MSVANAAPDNNPPSTIQRRSLTGACLAHTLHDGFTDQLYAFLPLWQSTFGLSYAGLALLRVLYYGTMGALQIPGDHLTTRFSPRTVLTVATLVASLGFLIIALPGGLLPLSVGLVIAGIGSSVQHPRASLLVTTAYGKSARGPLGIYNFSGDLGKAIFPALVAVLLPLLYWRTITAIAALIGIATAIALYFIIPRNSATAPTPKHEHSHTAATGKGFNLLLTIGAFDTATRMGYLLFLPFLIQAVGGTNQTVGIGLALLFIGGALGKAVCGWLGAHLGVTTTVILTEAATALLILATLFLPLTAILLLLLPLGIVLNGTSSVLYGTVPDLAPRGDTGRAFAHFYTAVIISGGFAPIAYGFLADHTSRTISLVTSALTALIIIPLVLALRPTLPQTPRTEPAT